MATATPVPVLEAGTLGESSFLADYVLQGRPAVIRGAVAHWPATRRWLDRDYLRTRYSHNVFYCPHENHVSMKRTEVGRRSLPFAEALELAQTDEIAAFGAAQPSQLDADMAGFSFFSGGEPGFLYPDHRIFFFRNAGSAWHYHPFDETLMCQVMEPKQIGLLKVANPFHKYLRRLFYKEDYYDHPSAFEGLQGADLQWFSASLEAGDALYIPPLWWHGVIATSGRLGATVPTVWRSPAPVVVDSIRRMAAGEVDMLGDIKPAQLENLMSFARGAGVEAEMRAAWQRGLMDKLVSLAS
jgi:hypothetical protein